MTNQTELEEAAALVERGEENIALLSARRDKIDEELDILESEVSEAKDLLEVLILKFQLDTAQQTIYSLNSRPLDEVDLVYNDAVLDAVYTGLIDDEIIRLGDEVVCNHCRRFPDIKKFTVTIYTVSTNKQGVFSYQHLPIYEFDYVKPAKPIALNTLNTPDKEHHD